MEFFVKELREILHMPLIYAEKRSASSYNKNVISACCKLYVLYYSSFRFQHQTQVDPEKVPFQSATIKCSHYGDHRDRSTGLRPRKMVMARKCPFMFRVRFDPMQESYVVTAAHPNHDGHLISRHYRTTYQMKRY